MNKIKRLISIAAIGIFTLSSAGCIVKTQAGKDNTIVAKVGKEKIKVIDVRNKMKATEETIKEQYKGSLKSEEAKTTLKTEYTKMLNNLALEKLLYAKAIEMKLVPDANNIEAEVQKEIDNIKAMQFNNDSAKLEEALKTYGMTLDDLKNDYRESIKDNPETVAANRVQYEVVKGETVGDEEIKSYYDAAISQYTTNPGAVLSHIIVDTEEKAKDIKAQLDKGAKFEDLAKNNSDATSTTGGSLGFIEYDDTNYDQAFMAAAKTLKEDEISAPVKSSFGWHIIKATGLQKETKVQSLDEVKESIKAQILSSKQEKKFSELLEQWKKDAGYKIYEDKLTNNIF